MIYFKAVCDSLYCDSGGVVERTELEMQPHELVAKLEEETGLIYGSRINQHYLFIEHLAKLGWDVNNATGLFCPDCAKCEEEAAEEREAEEAEED